MALRLRFVLPVVNVLGGSALLIYAALRPGRGDGISPGPQPAVLCYLINAPASVFRNFAISAWDRLVVANCSAANTEACYSVGRIVEVGLFLGAVGLLWYLVGLEIESSTQDKRAAVPSWSPLRVLADSALIAIGVFLAVSAVAIWRGPVWMHSLWSGLGGITYTAWATAFIATYGRDLFRCITQIRRIARA